MANEKSDIPEWADEAADRVLGRFPDEPTYVGAAGISPSGVIHFGNFRDVATTLAVLDALQAKGKAVRFVYSWDDFDRFRKVPAGVPERFSEHIGKPLSAVPDPGGEFDSYAERFERQFEQEMEALGLDIEYLRQSELYAAGTYDDAIIAALKQRERIADILFSLMSEKSIKANQLTLESYRASYYPVSVYAKSSGKDFTTVTGYDGDRTLTYLDKETKHEETVTIGKDAQVKLAWKVDWPMRWKHEGVHFEPAGADHASPGSSFDAGDKIIETVYGRTPPVHLAYGFVGIQGSGKMSGSAGTGVSIGQLLEIYEPDVLKWLYVRKQPKQYFKLAFDTEIYRQYEEFDRAHSGNRLPFRQAVAFGQIVSWDPDKVAAIAETVGARPDAASVQTRLPRARTWLERYNPGEAFALLDQPNQTYRKRLSPEAAGQIKQLVAELEKGEQDAAALNDLVYGIPKDETLDEQENKKRQRAFFKDVYNLLIGKDTGPRLSTFLWAADREQVLKLLR